MTATIEAPAAAWRRRLWPDDGAGWAHIAVLVGSGISLYANVAAKFVRETAPGVWVRIPDPETDGIVLAALAPVIMYLMSEIFIRVRGTGISSWIARLATFAVASIGFVASYQHLRHLLLARAESSVTATLYPVAVDGLVIGALALKWQLRQVASAEAAKAAPPAVAPVVDAPTASAPALPTAPVPAAPQPADPAPAPEPEPAAPAPRSPRTPRTGRGKPSPGATEQHARIRAAARRNPRPTHAQIAQELGVSDRTVRRVLADTSAPHLTVAGTSSEEATG